MSSKKHCLIIGVGEGTGNSLVKRFAADDYHISMVARSESAIRPLKQSLGEAVSAIQCDVTEFSALQQAIDGAIAQQGIPDVVVFNAVSGSFGTYDAVELEAVEQNMRTNLLSLIKCVQLIVPHMTERGDGAFLVTGNTSAYRGKPQFAGFAPSKAAQRIFLEAVAREVWPKGVHIAYLAVDAVIDLKWMRERFPDQPDDFFCKPDDIAECAYQLVHQPRSAWTFDQMIRPFGEAW